MEGDLDQYTIAALTQEAIDCLPNALTIFDESLVPLLANKVSRELYEQLHRAMASGRSYREATFLSIKAADPKLCDDEAWQLADMLASGRRMRERRRETWKSRRLFPRFYIDQFSQPSRQWPETATSCCFDRRNNSVALGLSLVAAFNSR